MLSLSKKKSGFSKDLFWNSLGSGINGFNSLFYMIIATRINGIEDAGIFTYAFSISIIFYIIGIYSGRVYQITDKSNLNDNDYFISKLITCGVMLFASILFVLLNSYNLEKTLIISILCLYRTFEAFSEVLYGYYQKDNELYKVGISLTLKNIVCLISFFIVNLITKNILISTITMTVIYLLIMIIYDFDILKVKDINIKQMKLDKIVIFLKKGFSTFLLSFLVSLLVNIPRYIIDFNLSDSMNTIWGVLIMPASIMLMLSQFCLHPFLMKIFRLYENKDFDNYKKIVLKMIFSIFLIGIFIILAVFLLGIPILELVYGIELSEYKISFVIIMIGAILYGNQSIIYNLLIGIRKIREQIISYIIMSIIYIVINIYLISEFKLLGASIGYLLIMIINFGIYYILFKRSIPKKKEV